MQTNQHADNLTVKITPNDKVNPPGKLADAEVIFGADAGPLSGLKLIGFAIWGRRSGGRNVTFPARQYSVNGERRSFALLRPANGDASAQEVMIQGNWWWITFPGLAVVATVMCINFLGDGLRDALDPNLRV